MDTWEIGRLAYLLLLGGAILVWFLIHNRKSLGRTLQYAAAWGLIFMGAIAVIGLWGDIRQTIRPSQSVISGTGQIEVPRSPDGHYYLTLEINDQPVQFMIDTGATDVVLSRADARRAGLVSEDLAFIGRAMTANGEVRTAPVKLDRVALGPITDRNVRAWVNEGEMEQSLLGMAYLQRWSRIEITNGALVLTR